MNQTISVGGSTLCVICLSHEGNGLEFANIGDSSFAVFNRDPMTGRFRLYYKSKEQRVETIHYHYKPFPI